MGPAFEPARPGNEPWATEMREDSVRKTLDGAAPCRHKPQRCREVPPPTVAPPGVDMKRFAAFLLAAALPLAAHADEGMWTFDNFPSAKVGKKYGFTPGEKWLTEARLSSVRL